LTLVENSVDCEVVLPILHPKQKLFNLSKAKRRIERAGRRSGKTVGAAELAVRAFTKNRRVLYATPTSDQIQRFWTEVTRALEQPILAGVYRKNETEHSISRPDTEARIRAKTAWNADTLRGDYADLLILDEWQLMNESAWEEVGAPMLIDNDGDAVFIYTPPSLHARKTGAITKARDPRHAAKMFKRAKEDKSGRWFAMHFTSNDNPYLSKQGLLEVTADMTALSYRQEILAEDIDEVPGALWTRALIEKTRISINNLPELTRVVIGVDPSGSSTTEAGIVAAGLGVDNHVYILADRSLLAPSPATWARGAVELYYELKADRICGERNYGGDMVEETIRTIDPNVSYKDVEATRGKLVRAEPVAALYEKGMAHHVGVFDAMEEEQCSYVPGALSPNRMDGMVWAVTELVIGGTLGLIDYFKQGAAAAQLAAVEAGKTVRQPSEAPKPGGSLVHRLETNLAPGKPACPECGSEVIGPVPGGGVRCQACGVQWGRSASRMPLINRGNLTGFATRGRSR
jgi:hypothetical protein